MTAPANNDRPSETPKPPFGYDSFLDYKMWITSVPEWDLYARAELSALRAKAAAYDAKQPPPPEGKGSWIEAAISLIDPTEMIATGEDTEPVVGGEAIDLALAELAEFRAFKTAYDEAMGHLDNALGDRELSFAWPEIVSAIERHARIVDEE